MVREAPRFDAVGITVADMARSLEFYRVLGLEFPEEADGEFFVLWLDQVEGGDSSTHSSGVPNQTKPERSCRMQLTELWDRP